MERGSVIGAGEIEPNAYKHEEPHIGIHNVQATISGDDYDTDVPRCVTPTRLI